MAFSSFRYAFDGLVSAINSEKNFRIHLLIGFLVIILSLWLDLTLMEWVVIIICIGMVISLELINSSLEELCDIVMPDKHPMIKKSKDMAAAAVLVVSIVSTIVGIIILLPKILELG